ncbi:terpene cyclase/mutase family protein [Mycoplasmatota bacterium WC30]
MDYNVINWLLEKNNPSVRYNTLTLLLKKPQDDIDVLNAKKSIMENGDIIKILAKQNEDGSWGEPLKFYRDKYKGTVWTLLLLAELDANPNDERVKKACEFILNNSQEPKEAGFSVDVSKKLGGGLPSYVIPCLTGNMVYALIKLGYFEDPRVQKAINWIVKYQRTDDGDVLSKDKYHISHRACFNKHSCHMGVAKAFKALAAIPKEKRTQEINDKITELANYFLIHHLYKKSHNLAEESKPGWKKLGFPLMYQTDILELLYIFSEIEVKDKRLEDAIQILKDRRTKNGKWKLQNSYNGRLVVDIEKKGEDSKWITLKALMILNRYEL